jgi:hypothetical protein
MEELTSSIFRVEEKVKQACSAVLAGLLVTNLTYSSTLKMEVVYSPECSVNSVGLYVLTREYRGDSSFSQL